MTNAILAALVNGAIVSALLAGAVHAGLSLTPRRLLTAAARHAVWCIALLATVLLPLAYLHVPASRTDVTTAAAPVSTHVVMPTPAAAPATPAHFAVPERDSRFPLIVTAGPWARWILFAWAALSSILLLRLLASCILLQRRKAGAAPAPEQLRTRVAVSLTRRVAVLQSESVATPVLAGLWRPAILIPARLLAEMSAEDLAQIALHEAAHAARYDDYALLAERMADAAMPFHTVVRWIARQIDLERELACDDMVVAKMGAPRRYAECLTRVVELCGDAAASWAGTGVASHLTTRVERLLDRNRPMESRSGKGRMLLAVGIVAVLAFFAGRAPRAIAFAMPPESPLPLVTEQPPAPLQQQLSGPIFVQVTVQDLANRYVPGLTKESFRLTEDDIPQQIGDFTVRSPPLAIGIVLDVSGSMRDNQPLVDVAVAQLVKSANPQDEFFVVTFNDEVTLVAGLGDLGSVMSQVHLRQPRGGTASRDAILQALQWQNARYRERMLVVISDGVDNASSVRSDELLAADDGRTPIWAITLNAPETYPRPHSAWLHELADQSRAHEFVSQDPGQVAGFAAGIANPIVYEFKYQPANTPPDGKFSPLRVNVVTAPAGSLKITTRYSNGGR